jgi:hypothetical protein
MAEEIQVLFPVFKCGILFRSMWIKMESKHLVDVTAASVVDAPGSIEAMSRWIRLRAAQPEGSVKFCSIRWSNGGILEGNNSLLCARTTLDDMFVFQVNSNTHTAVMTQ